MRGVPSSLTVVESRSASNLGKFYCCPSVVPVGPKATQPSPVEPTVEYAQTEAGSPQPTSAGLDRFTKWDTEEVYTEEVQDWSCAPSPTAVITVPLQGEALVETPPTRQNRCLVSEHFIEPGAALPHEHTPEAEVRKTPQTINVPVDEQEPAHVIVKEDVVEFHMGTEEL